MTLAIQIQAVAVGWQVYEMTHDPLSLGLIGLAEAIPAITVSLYAGHLADVTERKKILLFCVKLSSQKMGKIMLNLCVTLHIPQTTKSQFREGI